MAVPLFCKKNPFANLNMLQSRMRLMNLMITLITALVFPLFSSCALHAATPPAVGMLVYKLLTSQVTRIVSGGRVWESLIVCILCRKSLPSCRYDGSSLTSGASSLSTHCDINSVGVPLLLQIGLPGGLRSPGTLCIFGKKYRFPAFGLGTFKYSAVSSSITLESFASSIA